MARTTGAGSRTAPRKQTASGRPARKTAPSAPAASERETRRKRDSGPAGRGEHALHVHTVHPSVTVPYLTPDDVAANVRRMGDALPRLPQPLMPSAKRLAFYGGLGALAVLGALEWPVALAIAAGTAVAGGARQRAAEPTGRPAEAD